jgi:Signal peptidase, peptidase S26
LKVDRDKYYIATKNSYDGLLDYDLSKLRGLSSTYTTTSGIQTVLASPELWDSFAGWQSRRSVTFEMQEDQFFPMGDNSPESQDARCWAGTKLRPGFPISKDEDAYRWADAHYVPRDLLVGKALMVFWPHPWNRPVPFTPNLKKIKLIR